MINNCAFMGRVAALSWTPSPNWPSIAISIVEPNYPQVALPNHYVDVLRLHFHDVRDEPDKEPSILPGPTAQIGQLISEFLAGYHSENQQFNLVVHCQEGVSRSAAVAKFVRDIMDVPIKSPSGNDGSCYNRSLFNYIVSAHRLEQKRVARPRI